MLPGRLSRLPMTRSAGWTASRRTGAAAPGQHHQCNPGEQAGRAHPSRQARPRRQRTVRTAQARHWVSPGRDMATSGMTDLADIRVSARISSAMSAGGIISAGSILSCTQALISVST